MKKRLLAALICVVLLAGVVVGLASCTRYDDELVVYNWADYIFDDGKDLQKEFGEYYKAATGRTIKITYETFDTNEVLLTKVFNGGANADVMCPSDYAIEKLIAGGYLQEINYFTDKQFKNDQNIDNAIVTAIKNSFAGTGVDVTKYFVPYMWGTLGILYNADIIKPADAAAAGWGLLWNDNGKGGKVSADMDGKIFMKDSVRDAYCAAVLYLKEKGQLPEAYKNMTVQQLINNTDDALIAAVETVLTQQKDVLLGYEVDLGKNDLISGRAYVDLAWSGDAFYAIEEAAERGVTLAYLIPQSGSNVWLDGWVIPKTSKNPAGAKLFIDFLNDPVIAAKNMAEIGYTSAVSKTVIKNNAEAADIIFETYGGDMTRAESDAAFYNDTNRYPNPSSSSFGIMHDFGDRNEAVITMWERVRAGGSSEWIWIFLIVVGAVAVVGAGVFVVIKLTGGRKRRRVTK